MMSGAGCVSSALDSDAMRAEGASGQPAASASVPAAAFADESAAETSVAVPSKRPAQTTASQTQTVLPAASQPAAETETPLQAAARARQIGRAEIRAKAAVPTTSPPNINDLPRAATAQLSAEERAALIRQLNATADGVQSRISGGEITARQSTIKRLKNQATSHYDDALKTIEE